MPSPVPQHLKDFKQRATPILKKAGVVRSHIFGSYARGDFHKKSDIDLLVQFKPNSKRSIFDFIGVKQDLENIFGRKVDLLTYKSVHPYLVQYIQPDKVKIL